MKQSEDTTLGDMAVTDRDNIQAINKESKIYKFMSAQAAHKYMCQAYDKALRTLGVKIRPGMDAVRIDRLLVSRGVRIEHREYPPDEPDYVSGFFFYKMSEDSERAIREIAFFVSNPFTQVSGKIQTLYRDYFIKTNVNVS